MVGQRLYSAWYFNTAVAARPASLRALASFVRFRIKPAAGIIIAIRMPRIAITTSISTNVNPFFIPASSPRP